MTHRCMRGGAVRPAAPTPRPLPAPTPPPSPTSPPPPDPPSPPQLLPAAALTLSPNRGVQQQQELRPSVARMNARRSEDARSPEDLATSPRFAAVAHALAGLAASASGRLADEQRQLGPRRGCPRPTAACMKEAGMCLALRSDPPPPGGRGHAPPPGPPLPRKSARLRCTASCLRAPARGGAASVVARARARPVERGGRGGRGGRARALLRPRGGLAAALRRFRGEASRVESPRHRNGSQAR